MTSAPKAQMPKAGLFLFFASALIIVLLFATRPPDPAASTLVQPTPARTAASSATPNVANVPTACRSLLHGAAFSEGTLDERSRAAQGWLEAHRGQQASVVITDDVLNEAAAREAKAIPVRDLRVTIERAGFRLSANAVFFATFPIKVLLVPQVAAGAVRIETRELDTDGLPGFLRGSVEDSIKRAADPTGWGLKMRVDGIATASGCAVVWGTA